MPRPFHRESGTDLFSFRKGDLKRNMRPERRPHLLHLPIWFGFALFMLVSSWLPAIVFAGTFGVEYQGRVFAALPGCGAGIPEQCFETLFNSVGLIQEPEVSIRLPLLPADPHCVETSGAFGCGSVDINIQLGEIGALLLTEAGIDSLLLEDPTSAMTAIANIIFDLSWRDTFTIVSLDPAIPDGTPVELMASLTLRSLINQEIFPVPPGTDPFNGVQHTSLILGNTLELISLSHTSTVSGISILDAKDTATFSMPVGTPFTLSGRMIVASNVITGYCPVIIPGTCDGSFLESFSLLDAFNSATFNLDVVTPDASYTTASGLTYFTPSAIPEPSSLLLLGSGLAGLVAWRVRRPKRKEQSIVLTRDQVRLDRRGKDALTKRRGSGRTGACGQIESVPTTTSVCFHK